MKKLTLLKFIEKANLVHNKKYNYEQVIYKNNKAKVIIVCPNHGEFIQRPVDHLNGAECFVCKGNEKKTTERFIAECISVHNSKYSYEKCIYLNNKSKVIIICKIHGSFKQKASDHLSGRGCKKCITSKGEKKIENFLQKFKIKYEKQKMFKDCKNIKPLKFDFYLSKYNMCIEYDGEHHFKPIEKWGGHFKLKETQKCDQIKNEYCSKNNIHLVRISYKQYSNIDKLMKYYLEEEENDS